MRFRPEQGGYVAAPWVRATLVQQADGSYVYTLPDQQADVYDSTGQLVSQTDPNGYDTTFTYSGGRLASVTDQAGRSLTFGYDGNGRLYQVSDPAGRTVHYGYDNAGNLESVTDVGDEVTHYEYDGTHRLTAMVDPRGGRTENTYDASDRVVLQKDRKGGNTTFSYSGTSTTVTDQAGNVSTHQFDASQNCLSISRGVGTASLATWTYTYDPVYLTRLTATDPKGNTTRARWDTRGNPVVRADPLGHKTHYTYDARNRLTSVTDALGAVTTVGYDEGGNPKMVSRRLNSTQVSTTAFTYDPDHPGDLIEVVNPVGKATLLAHDAAGNVTSVTDPAGGQTTYGYNAIGWRASSVSPRGNVTGANPAAYTTTIDYNNFGNPTVVTDPLGGTTTMDYDANQNRTALTDPNGHTTSWGYSPADEPTETTSPEGATWQTTYTAAGDIATQVDPLGHTTSYHYDSLRRPDTMTDTLTRVTAYGYDKAGNLTTLRDPMGRTTTFGYDQLNHRTGITYSDGVTPNVTFGYNAVGQRTSMTDGTGTSTFVYDALRRLTSTTTGSGATVTYGYDLAGQLTTIGYPSRLLSLSAGGLQVGAGTVRRAYDPAGRLASVTDWLNKTTTFSYDPDGNQVGTTYPNGTSETATYDAAGRLSRSTATGPTGVFLDLPYTRDAAGNVTSDNALGMTPPVTRTFTYDRDDRLTATGVGPPAAGLSPKSYAYDDANDITRMATPGLADILAYDNGNQLTTRTNADGSTVNYSYDQDGNRRSSVTHGPAGTTTTRTYSYDQANRLVLYSGPAMNAVNQQVSFGGPPLVAVYYAYDGDGLRSDIVWDRAEGLPLPLFDSLNPPGGTVGRINAYITGPGGLPLERLDPTNGVLYYHHDQLGSTRALTDKDGRVVQTYSYDPYGNTLSSTGAIVNPFRFAGQYTDFVSGLVYMRARWYDPKTAQFLTRDPIEPQTRDPYGYVGGNPLNVSDPSGLCWSAGCWIEDHWQGLSLGLGILAFAVALLAVPAFAIGAMAVADGAVAGAGWFGVSTFLGYASSGVSALQMTVICANGSQSACDWSMATFGSGVGTTQLGRIFPGPGALLGLLAAGAGLANPNLDSCASDPLPSLDPAGVTRDPRMVGP